MCSFSTQKRAGRKVLLIGLDGATWDLLKPWMDESRLPTLHRLVGKGASGDLLSTVPPLTAAAWISLSTGKNPAKHGIFDFVFPRLSSYDVSVANIRMRDSRAIWNMVSDHGKKVAIVGVPMTYPPEEVNGLMISCFMTPDSESQYTYPVDLKQELSSKGYEFPTRLSERNRSRNVRAFLREVAADTEARVRTVLYLLENKPWDLFAFVFLSPDLLQHDLWHIMDPLHPQHRASENRYLEDIARFYTRLDGYLGDIVSRVDDSTLVLVVSDHGFGRATHFFYVNNWLLSQGLLRPKRNLLSQSKHLMFKLGITPMNGFRLLSLLRLGWLRKSFRFGRNYDRVRRITFSFDDIEWSKTKAFSVGNFGQIYLNVKERQPCGTVEPGEEYELLRQEIANKLLEYRDPTTGKTVIESVLKKEELFSGPYVEYAPDLIPFSQGLEYVSFGTSDFGSNKISMPIFGLSGYHRMEGILVAAGADVKSNAIIQDASILDIAPTILYAMGLPIPSDMDGKVLFGAFRTDFTANNPVVFDDSQATQTHAPGTYTQAEEEQIRRRLKGMGYGA